MKFSPIVLIVLAQTAAAQSCPAINFLATPQLVPSANAVIVTVRQADGSFTGYGLAGATPSYTIPNIQNSVSGCIPATKAKGPKVTINFKPAGMPSEPGAIVDLNGNGTPELLVAETTPGLTVDWDFNLAAPTHLLPQVTNPVGVQVADLNGDGKPDLLLLDAGDFSGSSNVGGVYILLNNGDKTFKQTGHYTVNGPGSVAVADINGDGKPDMVVGQQGVSSVEVFLGNGDGTFQNPTTVAAASDVLSVMLVDFNRDGKLDLAVNTYAGGTQTANPIAILLGDGKGGFSPFTTVQTGGDSTTMTSGDFNGDGIPDIATGNFRLQTVSVLLGKGDGSFGAPVSYVAPYGPSEITVTDFNNDGIADILIGVGNPEAIGESENSEVIGVLLGNGDGTFQGAATNEIGSATNATLLAVADFNGDGNVDAIVGDAAGAFDFFAGKGDGTFQAPVVSMTQGSGPAVVGDFNGDGRPDLAMITNSGIQILVNNGSASFQSSATVAPGGTNPAAIATADFNGDGHPDLAVANSGDQSNPMQVQAGNVAILTGGGNGGFAPGNTYPAGTAPRSIAAADLNGDGKQDLIVADGGVNTFGSSTAPTAGAIYVLLNQGAGAFSVKSPYTVGVFPIFVAAADVNHDGKPDLIVLTTQETTDYDTSYQVGVLLGNGDGTFQAAQAYPVDFGPSSAVVADFNGDGNPDIAIAHCCGDTEMGYLVGRGDGTFDAEVLFNGGASPSLVATGDINKDGKADLLIAGDDPASFTPLLNVSIKSAPLSVASSAPAASGTGVAADSIASAYGTGLATQTFTATTVGTTLGGTSVSVTDSAGTTRAAVMYFVSSGQVNFQIPPGTVNGAAMVTVHTSGGTNATGSVQVNTVAPGIYEANANGLAAGLVFSYKPDGTHSYQDTFVLDASTNQVVPNPISLDPQTNQVYLQLYGTGLRHATSGGVTVRVGALTLTPQFVGAQGVDPGLDQVNILLPYSLKGSGDVAVTVTANGVTANTVHVTIE